MDKIKNLIENFSGNTIDLCFEILKESTDQEAAFEYTCKNFLKKPENGNIKIEEYFSDDEKNSYESFYGFIINGLIRATINKCNSGLIEADLFYSELWKSFLKNFSEGKELAFAFYYTIIDRTIPYQYLGEPISMNNERFRALTDENKPTIEKIKYIKANQFSQKTEVSSLVLNCLDEVQDRESKAVVLAHAISILGSKPSFTSEDDIDSLIKKIDQKIKELEEELAEEEDD